MSVASKTLNSNGISQTSSFSVTACSLNEPNPVDVVEWAARYPWLIRYLYETVFVINIKSGSYGLTMNALKNNFKVPIKYLLSTLYW